MSRKISAYGRKLARQQAVRADPMALYRTMGKIQHFTQDELVQLTTPPRVAFESLRRGHGTEFDFHTLAGVANNTLICAESIHPDCVEVAQKAQNALMRMLECANRLGTWGLDSAGLQDLPPVLDLHEQLLALHTPMQMQGAMRETIQRMKDGQTLSMESVAKPA